MKTTRPLHRARTRAAIARVLDVVRSFSAVTVSLLLGLACASPTTKVGIEQREAPVITLGLRQQGTLTCTRGRCAQWYRLPANTERVYWIEVSSTADPVLADFAIALFDNELEPLAGHAAPYQRPRRISERLPRGLYYLRVGNRVDLDAPFDFEVRVVAGTVAAPSKASWQPPPQSPRKSTTPKSAKAPARTPAVRPNPVHPESRTELAIAQPPPRGPEATLATASNSAPTPTPAFQLQSSQNAKPRPLLRSDVIEVERESGRPVSVLIDAGAATGLARGQTGRLLDDGFEIGRIEITDIYTAGSRARIVGELREEITDETLVEVFDTSE